MRKYMKPKFVLERYLRQEVAKKGEEWEHRTGGSWRNADGLGRQTKKSTGWLKRTNLDELTNWMARIDKEWSRQGIYRVVFCGGNISKGRRFNLCRVWYLDYKYFQYSGDRYISQTLSSSQRIASFPRQRRIWKPKDDIASRYIPVIRPDLKKKGEKNEWKNS